MGSTQSIRNYLHRWALWWVNTAKSWTYEELLQWFYAVCWNQTAADYAAGLVTHYFMNTHVDFLFWGSCAQVLKTLLCLLDIDFQSGRPTRPRQPWPSIAPHNNNQQQQAPPPAPLTISYPSPLLSKS